MWRKTMTFTAMAALLMAAGLFAGTQGANASPHKRITNFHSESETGEARGGRDDVSSHDSGSMDSSSSHDSGHDNGHDSGNDDSGGNDSSNDNGGGHDSGNGDDNGGGHDGGSDND